MTRSTAGGMPGRLLVALPGVVVMVSSGDGATAVQTHVIAAVVFLSMVALLGFLTRRAL